LTGCLDKSVKNAKAKLEGLFDWKSEKASDFERLGPLSID